MRHLALFAALMAPAQAFGLSCLEPSVPFSYASAAASEDSFVIAVGTLDFDTAALPKSTVDVMLTPPPVTKLPATMSIKTFTGDDFSGEVEAPVELQVFCAGPWCPSLDKDVEHLMFIKEGESAFELAINPCGGMVFSDPSPEMLEEVIGCYKDKNCTLPEEKP